MHDICQVTNPLAGSELRGACEISGKAADMDNRQKLVLQASGAGVNLDNTRRQQAMRRYDRPKEACTELRRPVAHDVRDFPVDRNPSEGYSPTPTGAF